jgi:hypothetical protein
VQGGRESAPLFVLPFARSRESEFSDWSLQVNNDMSYGDFWIVCVAASNGLFRWRLENRAGIPLAYSVDMFPCRLDTQGDAMQAIDASAA